MIGFGPKAEDYQIEFALVVAAASEAFGLVDADSAAEQVCRREVAAIAFRDHALKNTPWEKAWVLVVGVSPAGWAIWTRNPPGPAFAMESWITSRHTTLSKVLSRLCDPRWRVRHRLPSGEEQDREAAD